VQFAWAFLIRHVGSATMSEIQAIPGRPRGRLPFTPAGYELCMKLDDKVVAGKTIIARKAGA